MPGKESICVILYDFGLPPMPGAGAAQGWAELCCSVCLRCSGLRYRAFTDMTPKQEHCFVLCRCLLASLDRAGVGTIVEAFSPARGSKLLSLLRGWLPGCLPSAQSGEVQASCK